MDEVAPETQFSAEIFGHAAEILRLFEDAGLILGSAESLTGGLLSAALTSVPGASHTFTGGITTYQTYQKHNLLNVEEQILHSYGPVSEECAYEMARGTLELFTCDGAIATTGIAGPDKDEWGRAVGTVFVSCAFKDDIEIYALNFDPSWTRDQIRLAAVKEALSLGLAFFKRCVRPSE